MRAIYFTEKDVTLRNNEVITLDRVLLIKVTDVSSKIVATVKVWFTTKQFILFEGGSYKPLNEFTEQEINNRIIEIL
jgi:hypothetical protein